MGLGNKKENKKTTPVQEKVQETDYEKIKKHLEKNNNSINKRLKSIIENDFIEGITDYNKCKIFIDFCNEFNNELDTLNDELIKIYHLFMNYENTALIYNLLKLIIKNTNFTLYIKYVLDSRSYFSDTETWFARIYEVINNEINIYDALEEDKMRIGIYPNISTESIIELNKKLEKINTSVNELIKETKTSEEVVDRIKNTTQDLSSNALDKIDSTYKLSIKEIQSFTNESIDKIKQIINYNPSSKKEILKELEKQFNVIDAFDENINIKERYEKLLSLKSKTKIYHPKFNEILKYIIIGNTVCLSGPSKCGKTNIAKQISELFGLSFANLGIIHDETTQINGYYDLCTNYNKSVFQNYFENGGLVLIKNINKAVEEAIIPLNNIIGSFNYNPYIFGDKVVTTPNKDFRIIMTNNNGVNLLENGIDNLIIINLDYDTDFEKSLTTDKYLLDMLFNLRKEGLAITTDTFINITTQINLGLLSIEEILINYIINCNNKDLLNRTCEKLTPDNNYGNTLKKILKG